MKRVKTSRLSRTSEKQNKKQALFFTLGTIILIGVLLQFGPTLINVFGNIVYTIRGGDKSDAQIVGDAVLQPPILVDIPEATQSSRISFRGTAPSKEGTIEVYVNDELEDQIELEDNKFEAKNISLKKGANKLKARYVKDEKTSPFTDDFPINYISDKPKLEVTNPVDNATFSKADKSINVAGTTDPDNTITVNSFRAIVEANGEFSYLLQLNEGENQITIEAQNPAGVITQKTLKATYTP